MKQYTIGKKAAVIVLHQLFMILMVTGVFAIYARLTKLPTRPASDISV